MSVDYTQEKLFQAVESLVGAGSIQSRLAGAAGYLIRLRGSEPAFPAFPELQARFDGLIDALTSIAATGDEGSIVATTRTLSNENAEKLAVEVLSLLCEATRLARLPVGAFEAVDAERSEPQ